MRTIENIVVILLAVSIATMPALAQDQTKDKSDFPVLTGPYLGQEPSGKTPLRFNPRDL